MNIQFTLLLFNILPELVATYPGEGTHIFGHGGGFRNDDLHFWDILSNHDLIDPLFLKKKISLSLSHLVPEILGAKVGIMFHQNVLFNISSPSSPPRPVLDRPDRSQHVPVVFTENAPPECFVQSRDIRQTPSRTFIHSDTMCPLHDHVQKTAAKHMCLFD